MISILFVTGCGSKNQVKCTGTFTEGGFSMDADLIADFDGDEKITDAKVIMDLKDSTTANQFCTLYKMAEDSAKGITVSCSGSKITITGFGKLESEDDDDKFVGKTKEEFIKAMEAENFTCK